MRIMFVTDAWHPQVNGVVETMTNLLHELRKMSVEHDVITPSGYPSLPLPTYPDIRLALTSQSALRKRIDAFAPQMLHIVTEGPLGMTARAICLQDAIPFTTSYHTRFPEYLRARLPVPVSLSYRWIRSFHNAGRLTLAATPSLVEELRQRDFANVRLWTRGVDPERFNPAAAADLGLPRPVFLSVGRVAVEKNLPAFLDMDLPGSKLVVGSGPDLDLLKRRYPKAHFVGPKFGAELARIYASSDVFVFPSLTDTFGMVILEALASGLPVAAHPVTGPKDIVGSTSAGALDADLRLAALRALDIPRDAARARALDYRWSNCAQLFLNYAREALSAQPAARAA
jgi:glycosyltransferase involved in cell wall biosynthesis